MENQVQAENGNQENPITIDSWEEAFAALEPKDAQATEAAAGSNGDDGEHDDTNATGNDVGNNAAIVEAANNAGDQGQFGEPDPGMGADSKADGSDSADVLGVSATDVEQYRSQIAERVRDQAVADVAKAFIDKGIRHQNGKLGATINDPDICKRDSDGVPRFYNPETGNEFTGDNPRRQAQEWVDDYNKELAQVFNQSCEKYEKQLMEKEEPAIAVLEFAPKYDELDPIRKGMLDDLLEDYEIKDSDGEVIGYSCNLDSALAAVNRQVARIQSYAKQQQATQAEPETPAATGPALDMKNSAAVAKKPEGEPKSLEEAMLMYQDNLLAKQKKN